MMYVPDYYAERSPEAMHRLIDAHPLATLVRMSPDGLEADHVPCELVPDEGPCGVLRAHVGRANPLVRQDGVAIMAIFQSASSYISPTVYDLEAAGGRIVPTWNYAVVHAHGHLRVVDDADWIVAHVRRATLRRERDNGTAWTMDEAPPEYMERMVAKIVGIEIAIVRMEAKFKLSQNRAEADRERAARVMTPF